MQYIPLGILETLAPYLQYAWIFPAAIVGIFLGWRIRHSDALNREQDHQETLQARELRLRTFQSHLDSRDREISEQKQLHEQELVVLMEDLNHQKSQQEELKSTIGKTNTLLAEGNRQITRQQRQFAEERTRLEQKNSLFEQQIRSAEGYTDKFNALKSKYKHMDARRSREIVELRADIVNLKRDQITLEEDRDKHLRFVADMQNSLEQLNNEHAHQHTLLQATQDDVKDRDQDIRKLKQSLTLQASEFGAEKQSLLGRNEAAKDIEARLARRKQENSSLASELEGARKQTESLLTRIQELSDTNQKQLQDYDSKHSDVSRRLSTVQDESAREIKTLNQRLSDMGSLRTVNKNQSRSIERLETQLQDLRKRNSELSDLDTELKRTRTEMEQRTSALDAAEAAANEHKARQATLQEDFKNRGNELENLTNKHDQTRAELSQKTADLQSARTAAREQERKQASLDDELRQVRFDAQKIDGLKTRLAEKEKKLLDTSNELGRLQKLKGQLADRDQQLEERQRLIARLQQSLATETAAREKLGSDLETNRHLLTRERAGAETMGKQLSVARELTESQQPRLQELEAQTLAQASENATLQQKVGDRENKVAGLIAQTERLKSVEENLQNKTTEFEKTTQQQHTDITALNAELARLTRERDAARNQLNGLEKHHTTQKEKILELQSTNESLDRTNATLQNQAAELDTLRIENRTLANLRNSAEQLKPVQQSLQQAETKNQQLAQNNKMLIKQIDAQKPQLQELARLQKSHDEQEKLLSSLKLQRSKLKPLQDELDKARAEQRILNDQLVNSAADKKALADAAGQLKELESLPQELGATQAELNRMKQAFEAENKAAKETGTTLMQQSAELARLQDSAQRELRALNQAEHKIKELERATTTLEKQEKALQQELSVTLKEFTALQNQAVKNSDLLKNAQHQLADGKATLETLEKARTTLTAKDNTIAELKAANSKDLQQIKQLQKENERFRILEASIQDRDGKIAQLNDELETLRLDSTDAQGVKVELKRLHSEVQSLTRERDLGLARVRELSELSGQLTERDNLIHRLKSDMVDSRVNSRELEALRSRLQKQEQEASHKNQVIEDLKKMLADSSRKPLKPVKAGATTVTGSGSQRKKETVPARGPAVSKTGTTRPASLSSAEARRKSPLSAIQKDDLKKIRGIGPVLEKTLNRLGITSYIQIASFSERDIERIAEKLDTFPGRIGRDDWIGGARKQHEKKYGK